MEVARDENPGHEGLPYATWPLARTVLGVVVGLLLGAVLLPAPVAIFDPSLDSYAALIVAQALLGAAFLGTALVVADDRRSLLVALSRLGVRRFRVSAIWTLLAAYLAYLVALAAYASRLIAPDQQDIARDLGLDSSAITAALSMLLIAGLAPIAEELFFRGMFFGGLRVQLCFLPAALISGVVFGSLHLPTGRRRCRR